MMRGLLWRRLRPLAPLSPLSSLSPFLQPPPTLSASRLSSFLPSFGTCRGFAKQREQPTDQVRQPINYKRVYDPQEIAVELKQVQDQLLELAHEPYAKHRGRTTLNRLYRQKVGRRINTRMARDHVMTLLYRHHALRHGKKKLNEMCPKTLGKSFLGPHTHRKISLPEAKEMIKNIWRKGFSERLDHLRRIQDEGGVQEARRKKRAFLRARLRYQYPNNSVQEIDGMGQNALRKLMEAWNIPHKGTTTPEKRELLKKYYGLLRNKKQSRKR